MRLCEIARLHTAPSPAVDCGTKGVCTTATSTLPGLRMKPSPDRASAPLPKHRAELNITTSTSVCPLFSPFFLQVAPRFGDTGRHRGRVWRRGPGTSRGCWLCAPPGSSPLLCAALSYSDPGERNTCKNRKMSWQSQRNLANELLSLMFFVLTQPVSQFCSFGVCVVSTISDQCYFSKTNKQFYYEMNPDTMFFKLNSTSRCHSLLALKTWIHSCHWPVLTTLYRGFYRVLQSWVCFFCPWKPATPWAQLLVWLCLQSLGWYWKPWK